MMKEVDELYKHFDRIPALDGQTNGLTDGSGTISSLCQHADAR